MLPSTAIALAAVSAPFATAATVHKRLIGGQVAKPGEIPFMVSLQINGGGHHCGGALLDSTTVLTAAHCLREDDTVRAGSIDRESGGVVVDVASIHQHPKFRLIQTEDGFKSVFDIGVVKLAKPIATSDTIQFAALATSGSRPEVGSLQTAAGWGLDEQRAFSAQLRRVDLPVSDVETCKDKENPEDTDIICAGGDTIGILSGDSGSPLIDPASRQVVGVVSRGPGESIVKPQTFTNVGSYIDFIMQHVEKASEGGSSANEETTGNDQTSPSTGDDDDSARIQRDFALIRDIPNLQFAFNRDRKLKSELGAKLQAAEDDLLANVGEPDFRVRVERHFAEFTNVPGVKAAMNNDATLAFQLPAKLSEAKQDLLALAGSAFN